MQWQLCWPSDKKCEQECIPVGCVPSAALAVSHQFNWRTMTSPWRQYCVIIGWFTWQLEKYAKCFHFSDFILVSDLPGVEDLQNNAHWMVLKSYSFLSIAINEVDVTENFTYDCSSGFRCTFCLCICKTNTLFNIKTIKVNCL